MLCVVSLPRTELQEAKVATHRETNDILSRRKQMPNCDTYLYFFLLKRKLT